MLLYYLLTLLTIALPIHGVLHNYDNDIGKEWFSKEAEIYFRKRCWHNRRQLRYVLRELRNFNTCFDQLFPNLSNRNDEEVQENCFDRRQEVIDCFKSTVDLLEPCLPPEEDYLPDLVMQSFEGFTQFLCENAHLTTLKGLVDTNMATCIDRFTRSQLYHPHYLCYQLAQFGNHSYNDPILKEEFCGDLDNLYECFERQYNQQCPDAPKAWEFQSGLLDALRAPCIEDTEGLETSTESCEDNSTESGEEYNEDGVTEEEENEDEGEEASDTEEGTETEEVDQEGGGEEELEQYEWK